MTEQTPEEKLIQQGIVASAMLEDPVIMGFFTEQLNDYTTALVSTDPSETALRQQLYYQHKALSTYIDRLRAYKASADQLIEEIDNQ